MSEPTDIVVAEDNPRDREFLADALADYSLVFGATGREALEIATQREEPWLITDLQMPEMNGVELARMLWSQKPAARIIFWSQHKDEMYVRALARITPPETVYGYVLKNNPSEVLHKAIDAVFKECQCWVDPKIRPVQALAKKADAAISDVEYEVLIDIALGLTDNMMAQRHYLSRRGVQSRLKSLYSKLGVDQEQFMEEAVGEALNMRARAVSVALRRGLINTFELNHEEEKLQEWINSQRH